jgi:hypothetical protein
MKIPAVPTSLPGLGRHRAGTPVDRIAEFPHLCQSATSADEKSLKSASRLTAQWDKLSLDIFWLKDDNLADPDVIAAEIVEDLRAAIEEFELILGDLSS